MCDACEFIWGHGGNVLDPSDPTKVVIDSPQAIAGLATERSMITDGISPEAVTVYKEDESAGAFLNGDASLPAQLALRLRPGRRPGLLRS